MLAPVMTNALGERRTSPDRRIRLDRRMSPDRASRTDRRTRVARRSIEAADLPSCPRCTAAVPRAVRLVGTSLHWLICGSCDHVWCLRNDSPSTLTNTPARRALPSPCAKFIVVRKESGQFAQGEETARPTRKVMAKCTTARSQRPTATRSMSIRQAAAGDRTRIEELLAAVTYLAERQSPEQRATLAPLMREFQCCLAKWQDAMALVVHATPGNIHERGMAALYAIDQLELALSRLAGVSIEELRGQHHGRKRDEPRGRSARLPVARTS
jgi:hypothetical protein